MEIWKLHNHRWRKRTFHVASTDLYTCIIMLGDCAAQLLRNTFAQSRLRSADSYCPVRLRNLETARAHSPGVGGLCRLHARR